ASVLPSSFCNSPLLPLLAFLTASKAKPKPLDSIATCADSYPSDLNILSKSSDGRCRPVSAARNCVVATDVGTPEAVRVAIAAFISVIDTPAAAAAGATLNSAADSSPNVVLPP